MIYFDNVTKLYRDGTPALEDINLKIEPKEFVSIVGHSGAENGMNTRNRALSKRTLEARQHIQCEKHHT